MTEYKKIKNALISVFNKENLDEIVVKLHELDINMFSTGGTREFIASKGLPVIDVENLTGYPSILGGRVKTLHPGVFGGILARRGTQDDLAQLEKYKIPEIDLVIVDLYPFEETLASGAGVTDIIEKIDIGGISLIRAAAKNYHDVLVVPSCLEYPALIDLLELGKGKTTREERKWFAVKAFGVSSHYDAAIFSWMNGENQDDLRISLNDGKELRYGENPHQMARFYHFNNTGVNENLADAEVLQGKELSYNNLLDADAAWKSASDAYHSVNHLENKQAVSVVKHLNPCGLAVAPTARQALELAWAGDPISAFGGIICFTGMVDKEIALWFDQKFVEIIIAPEFTAEALEIFHRKKNLRLLVASVRSSTTKEKIIRSVSGGILIQDEDDGGDPQFRSVSEVHFGKENESLAKFGIMACKHLKSNAIALVTRTSEDAFWLTGAGMGQPNRLDSLRLLSVPRFKQKAGLEIGEAVLVSDAFFPFRDSIDVAHEAGIRFIVQPGGSIRDQEVIDACNQFGIALAFTGRRHFRH